MSYSAMICIRQAGEPPDEVANITESIIKTSFFEPEVSSVRVFSNANFPDRADDFGIAEVDIGQSRDFKKLSLLRRIFMRLCADTDWALELAWDGAEDLSDDFSEYLRRPRGNSAPVVFDPYSDEEQDNPYWEREEVQLAAANA